MIKLCKDCRWAKDPYAELKSGVTRWYDWICMHQSSVMEPLPSRRNLVTGDQEPIERMTCEWARGDGDDRCGCQARYWESPLVTCEEGTNV